MKFLRDIAKIWAAFVERIVYILDPHKKDEEKEYLRMQIEIERNERFRILDSLVKKPENEMDLTVAEYKPISPYVPWRVKRAQLENEHRIKVDPIQQDKVKQDIRKLEEELEIENATD